MKKRKFLRGFTRFRLMLTLGLAVLLPAAALILVNFNQLRVFERDLGTSSCASSLARSPTIVPAATLRLVSGRGSSTHGSI